MKVIDDDEPNWVPRDMEKSTERICSPGVPVGKTR